MNEAETRAELIDPLLAAAGWGVVEGSRIRREFSITPGRIEGGGRRSKPLTADDVLTYRNTQLAVVEAKPDTAPLTEGVAQAKDYAGKLQLRFTYASNGLGVYAVDMTSGEEGPVDAFPSPEELWARTFAEENAWRDRFAAIPYADKGGSWQIRFYQNIAVSRALEAIAAGRNRVLLTLATGTGKTSIAFQIIWKLFQARWNLSGQPTRRPRILFLADRNNLADQAFNDFTGFAAFEDNALARLEPDALRKKGRVPTNASVFLTTSQKLSTGVDARSVRNIVLLRPVNSMIEFKQIIGRGTRLYDGKDYFTILDFVKAHHHFSDPERDGDPIEPVDPGTPGQATGDGGTINDPPPPGPEPPPLRPRVKIKLGDGKERSLQHMLQTSFWHPDAKPMSSQQFIELLYGQLPEFVRDEAELRALWSVPDTRARLLQGLAEKGFGPEQLAEMQAIISAENSDLFDVLAYVAYALPPIPRESRAQQARLYIHSRFTSKQQLFLDFVLQHYVSSGVQELAQEKLAPLLLLRYQNSIADAVADLGQPEEIGRLFATFQRYLYEPQNSA